MIREHLTHFSPGNARKVQNIVKVNTDLCNRVLDETRSQGSRK